MNKIAIQVIAEKVRDLRVANIKRERAHMNFDCKFDDPEVEFDYVVAANEINALELFCCRTFEEAEFFGKCYADLTSPSEYIDLEAKGVI